VDLARWLIDPATRGLSVEDGLTKVSERLDALGLALSRVRISVPTLHPETFVRRVTWTPEDGSVLFLPTHALVGTPAYLDSPVAVIHAGGDAIRCKLVGPDADLRWPICREHAAEGCTEYACLPLVLGDGQRTFISLMTKRDGGFPDVAYDQVIALLPHIAAWIELKATQLASRGLLEVYLGKKAAARVLAGEVRRGTGAATHAAIWTCDLRGFTSLSDTMPAAEVVGTLDRYFEAVAGPIEDHGGEVLKFIGDAVLAIFPVIDGARADACTRALRAATAALDGMRAQLPQLGLGIALHIGEVMFGNIGARRRLDFTVIGAAVNEACRMEQLCKTLGAPLIVSAPFAAELGGAGLVSLGEHALRGVGRPQELFTITPHVA
jgi:adenylate cyclase